MQLSNTRLYVGNIDYRMPIQELEVLFSQFGMLEDVYLPQPPYGTDSRVNRGFAFVCFKSERAAAQAVTDLNGAVEAKFNRKLVVQFAKPRPEKYD